ncbi:hypothetical protein HID58_017903 [Brassica napus]|uniref:Fungal lipase-type domain-containing protein n=1 Tax=Brassica napus TaxID=3708 RepID=A0ABQ8D8F7_BRANA|nr:hypothetical protein HID58_017903 [Brassica napus]
MAARSLVQNPNLKQVPLPRSDKNLEHTVSLPYLVSLHNSNTHTSRRLVVSSSTSSVLAPHIPTSRVVSPPISRAQAPCSSAEATVPLSRVWREIQGCNNWQDLIEPLNPLLQKEITRYGNLVSTCYKAFDLNPTSKRYLNCKYGKNTLLRETGIDKPEEYQVTKYIYATPDININIRPIQNEANKGARWVGYVAVSSDDSVKRLGRRDVVVTFRGTVTNPEWLTNFMSSLAPARLHPHNTRPDVTCEGRVRYKGEDMSITLAGHSMGSSLAHLLAYDIAELGLNKKIGERDIPVTVFSFAGPRVGNLKFKKRCEELGVKIGRVYNGRVQRLAKFQFPAKISINIAERARPVSAKLVIGTTLFLLRRCCEDPGVDELVFGMLVLRDISLLDVEALTGRFSGRGRRATTGMALLVKTNRGWIDVRFRTHRMP